RTCGVDAVSRGAGVSVLVLTAESLARGTVFLRGRGGPETMTTIYAESADTGRKRVETATVGVLIALSASHMLNDVMQSLAPALYPVFRQEFALSFFQVGLITFVFQLTASFLQPL